MLRGGGGGSGGGSGGAAALQNTNRGGGGGGAAGACKKHSSVCVWVWVVWLCLLREKVRCRLYNEDVYCIFYLCKIFLDNS